MSDRCPACGNQAAYLGFTGLRPECPDSKCRFFSARRRDEVHPPLPETTTADDWFLAHLNDLTTVQNSYGKKLIKTWVVAGTKKRKAIVLLPWGAVDVEEESAYAVDDVGVGWHDGDWWSGPKGMLGLLGEPAQSLRTIRTGWGWTLTNLVRPTEHRCDSCDDLLNDWEYGSLCRSCGGADD